MLKSKFKLFVDYIIYLLFLFFIKILRIIGPDKSSDLMGKAIKLIGPFTKQNKIIRKNLMMIYPDWSNQKIKETIPKIWENFGRVAGEFAFVDKAYLSDISSRVKMIGVKKINDLISKNKKFIIFSTHSANWEIGLMEILRSIGKCSVIYRKINNKYINQYIKSQRKTYEIDTIEKGSDGSKDILKAIKNNSNLIVLLDQKMNEGQPIEFLGKPAMTSDSITILAKKYDYMLVPVFMRRKDGFNFEIEVQDAFNVDETADYSKDIYSSTKKINDLMSDWINKYPEQWFWQHQRWGKINEIESNLHIHIERFKTSIRIPTKNK